MEEEARRLAEATGIAADDILEGNEEDDRVWMLASGDAADSDTDDAGSASSSATDSSNSSSSGSNSGHSSSGWALHRQGMCRKQQMRTAMGSRCPRSLSMHYLASSSCARASQLRHVV